MGWIERFGHGGDVMTAAAAFQKDPSQLLDFSANINPLGPPRRVVKQIQEHLLSIVHYPDPAHRLFRKKLAERLCVNEQEIIIGNGAAECMALALLAIQPKKVGVVYPCFSEYAQLAKQFGSEVVGIYGREELQFRPDQDEMRALFQGTELVLIGHPNNPTGILYSREDLTRLAEWTEEFGTGLVIDEAFIDFLPEEKQITMLSRLGQFPRLIIVRSMTKFYAIPGLRLGFALGHPKVIKGMTGKQVTWSVNSLALQAGELCLQEQEYERATIRLIKEERNYLIRELAGFSGWKVWPGEANFLLVRLPAHWKADDLQWALGCKGIMIRNCSMYPGLTPQDIRLAVRSREENDRLLSALQEADQERRERQ